ncbi:AMP-binding protein [Sphingomonas albertensis]
MTTAADMLATGFATLPDLIHAHALERGDRTSVADPQGSIDYRTLDSTMDRVAVALQRDGVAPGTAVAIVAAPTTDYAAAFLGAVRTGCVATPIAPSATPAAIAAMIADSGAPVVFLDAENARALEGQSLTANVVLFPAKAGVQTGPPPSRENKLFRLSRTGSLPPKLSQRSSQLPPKTRSTSSTRPAPPARQRASSRATRCAGRISRATPPPDSTPP